jgi:hypothetical protein
MEQTPVSFIEFPCLLPKRLEKISAIILPIAKSDPEMVHPAAPGDWL